MASKLATKIIVVFLLLEFAASLTVISKREKFGNLLREIDRELELINRSSLRNITETLVMTLMISLLYTYLILTLYYVLLMDGENTFTRLMSTIGKVMIFVTLGIYVVAQYYFSTHEMFLVIQRLAILLFILSSIQIVHIAITMYNNSVNWPNISQIATYLWKKICGFFGPAQYELQIEATTV